jgi:hypothetical protein
MGQLPVTDSERTSPPPRTPHPGQHVRRGGKAEDEPVLPDTTSDEREVGWGDEPGERDDEWYRRERPPHHE